MNSTSNVPVFDRHFFDGQADFTRIGQGSLGGKANGLWQVREQILAKLDLSPFPEVAVSVPRLCVIATNLFDVPTLTLDRQPSQKKPTISWLEVLKSQKCS